MLFLLESYSVQEWMFNQCASDADVGSSDAQMFAGKMHGLSEFGRPGAPLVNGILGLQ